MEELWFLTVVQDGHVNLTSILASSKARAYEQTYEVFTNLLGKYSDWDMAKSEDSHVNSKNIITWELENKSGSWIKASLIKA